MLGRGGGGQSDVPPMLTMFSRQHKRIPAGSLCKRSTPSPNHAGCLGDAPLSRSIKQHTRRLWAAVSDNNERLFKKILLPFFFSVFNRRRGRRCAGA